MKKAILVSVIAAFLSVPIMAQSNIVYCKKIGDFSGRVGTFDGYCPLGWYRVFN